MRIPKRMSWNKVSMVPPGKFSGDIRLKDGNWGANPGRA
jgi:hypothetical protein